MKYLPIVLVAVGFLACSSSSPAAAAEKHGDYEVTVVSISRVKEWEDPTNRNMRYRANPDGIIVLVNLKVRTPNEKVALGESELKDGTGKTYKSNRDSYRVSWPKEEPQTDEITLPFILPAAAEVKTLILEGKTTFDVSRLAAEAKAKQ